MILIDLLCLTFIIVFIVDLSGVTGSIKRTVSSFLTKGKIVSDNWELKPITCSLCMTFWIELFYLIIMNQLSILNLSIVCLFALLTPVTGHILLLLRDCIEYILNKLNDLIC